MIFRVLILGDRPATEEWAERLRGDRRETEQISFAAATSVSAAFWGHAAVICLADRPELGIEAALMNIERTFRPPTTRPIRSKPRSADDGSGRYCSTITGDRRQAAPAWSRALAGGRRQRPP